MKKILSAILFLIFLICNYFYNTICTKVGVYPSECYLIAILGILSLLGFVLLDLLIITDKKERG